MKQLNAEENQEGMNQQLDIDLRHTSDVSQWDEDIFLNVFPRLLDWHAWEWSLSDRSL